MPACTWFCESEDFSSQIADHAAGDQAVPDEQHDQRADGGGDKARALVGTVMADRLAHEGREEGAGDAEQGGEDEAPRIVRSGRKETRDDSCDKADNDNPDDAAHNGRPFHNKRKRSGAAAIKGAPITRPRSATVRPASDGRSPAANIGSSH